MKISFSIVFNLVAVPVMFGFYIKEVKGKENIPKDSNFILASNHCSNLDNFLIATVLRKKLTKTSFIGKMDSFLQFFLFGWFYFLTETIPIDRRKKDKRRILDKAIYYLNKKYIIVIYPEGARNKENKLRKGKTGVAELSIRTGLPVIPCGIADVENSKKKILKFGKPIFPKEKKDSFSDSSNNYDFLRRFTNLIMKEISVVCGKEY